MIIKIGTRGSKLALRQAQDVLDEIKKAFPQHECRLEIITTKGDSNQKTPIHQMGQNGIFVKELEERLLDGTIDIAVHSMKDMPAQLPKGLCLAPTPKAQEGADVIVLKHPNQTLDKNFSGILGTGSARRIALMKELYPHAKLKGIRGNIDTRLQKLENEDYDGLVLAAAGLCRLGYQDHISYRLDPKVCIPACTQGILALEVRDDRNDLLEILKAMQDEVAMLRQLGERTFLQCVNGGCHIPQGAYVELSKDHKQAHLYAMLGKEDGTCIVKGFMSGTSASLQEMAEKLAKELIRKRDSLG